MSEHIFPVRLTRRDFIGMAGMAAVAASFPILGGQADGAEVKIGSGKSTYTLDEHWGKPPPPLSYGYGCGIVVDGQDRVYVHTRTNPSVMIFSRTGELLETWGEEFARQSGTTAQAYTKTAHGLYWSKEGGREYLYFTDHPRGLVTKTDLHGKILLTLGNVASESSTSIRHKFDNPTDVAISGNGDIYVCEGYGSQLVHRFDRAGKWIKTIGGKGAEHGKFNICHGIWINTLRKEPEIYIADRANKRIEIYSMDLEYKRSLEGNVRNPCCFYQYKDQLFVPDLGSRVTIFDNKDKLVSQLGDGIDPKDFDKNPATFGKPHALVIDSQGDLYVLEWLEYGRVRKFRHTPVV